MRFDLDRLSSLSLSVATVLLAAVTTWLAYDTHNLANGESRNEKRTNQVGILNECNVSMNDEAASGDSVIEVNTQDQDGFEESDALSQRDIRQNYLKKPNVDYLACTLTNFSLLPLLNVQTVFKVHLPNRRILDITSARFHVIFPERARTTWIVNNNPGTVSVEAPKKIRYQIFSSSEKPHIDVATPALNDRWEIYKDRDTKEILDQKEMAPF